jgi:hypothetical protein
MYLVKLVELEKNRNVRPDIVYRKDTLGNKNVFPGNKQASDRSLNRRNFVRNIFGYPVDFLDPQINIRDVGGIGKSFQHDMLLFISIVYTERKSIQAYLNG